jgi:sarcosine oxidase
MWGRSGEDVVEEFLVIGAGLAGASAAWQLTRRGQQVTVLEQTTPANAQGSSHGSARIFRYAYTQQLYCDLAMRARSGWDELERESGRTLIDLVGCINFSDTVEGARLAAVLDRAQIAHELLPADEASERWPQFCFRTPVVWQPDAGVLDPEATVEVMLRLTADSGHGRILPGWAATRLERTPAGYRVRSTAGETVEGSRVIIAAGGWLPDLVDGFGLPAALTVALPRLEVRQEQVYHFPYREQSPVGDGGAPRWPTFIHGPSSFRPPSLTTYGLPGGRDGEFRGQKLAQYNGGRVITSASAQDGVVSAENRALMVDYVKRHLPGLEPAPYAEATCLFTNTPTEDFIIDARDGVVVVSACSGHGAKFAPLLGEFAADLATGAGTVPSQFRLPIAPA